MSSKKLYLITGPTASGKTDLSIELALKLGSPILSCDSRQLYKELKIGTAPPSPEQLNAVKHYFIHSHSIFSHYTAGKYEVEALALMDELYKEHDSLVMVGGSGLYAHAVYYGIDDFPATNLELRKELTQRMEIEGIESLRKELKLLDPLSYSQIDIANPQRILRAIEVTLATGKKFSEYKNFKNKERAFLVENINIDIERDLLYQRINRRVDVMMEAGLLGEVKDLYPHKHLPALKTVGYRELFDYLDGKNTLETAVELIKRNTRRYAKRQITWFKRY